MDFIWIFVAFLFGLSVRQIGLPPLVGYLVAGFSLNLLGFGSDASLQALADIGITIMLFTVGLKLNVRSLMRPEILLAATGHCAIWCGVVFGKWLVLGALGLGMTTWLAID